MKGVKDSVFFSIALGLLLLSFFACTKKPEATISWAFFDLQTDVDLTSVKMESCDKWHIVGGETWSNGFYFQVNGQLASHADSLAPKRLNAICLDSKNNLYSVGYTGYFLTKSADSLANWHYGHLFDNLHILRDIDMLNDTMGVAVAGVSYHNGFIFNIAQDLKTVRIDTLEESLRAVSVISNTNAIAVGYGAIYKRQINGDWDRLPYIGDFYVDVDFPTPTSGYIVGNAGSILKSTDGGKTWIHLIEKNTYSPNRAFRAIHFINEDTGFITGEKGLLWKTTDGGLNWIIAKGLPDIEFHDIAVCAEIGVLVGKNGKMVTFDPNF